MPDEEAATAALMHVTMAAEMTSSAAQLLADAGFVRRLARTLTADQHDADDLAQDACLQALRSPPGHADNLKGWLQRVMQNLLRQRHRQERRRQQREQQVVTDVGVVPPTADLVERAATHRAVVDAVVALDEPYRTVVLLRFFEELPPRAIAQRLGVPVATVHTRLGRGLDRLRSHLDSTRGRRIWCAALAPLPQLAAAVPGLGVLAMKGKAIAVGAAVLVSATAVVFGPGWFSPQVDATATAAGPAPVVSEASTPVASAADAAVPATDGHERQAAPVTVPKPVRDEPAPRQLRGRVVNGDGQAAPGLEVAQADSDGLVADGAPASRSGVDGGYELTLTADSGRVVVADPAWQTVMTPTFRSGQPPQFGLVVAAPAVALAGAVRAGDGTPIADARIQVVWPADLRSRLSDIHDSAEAIEIAADSRSDGAFALIAGTVRGAQLLTTAEGWLPDRRPLPDFSDRSLAITLTSPVGQPGSILGQVVDQHGLPVIGARIGLGGENARSDEQGHFVLADDRRSERLVAAASGHRAATVTRRGDAFPAFVLVTLGSEPLTIRGRVVDGHGNGVADAKVWLLDATLLSSGRDLAVTEGVAGGCLSIEELIQQIQSGQVKDPEAAFRATATAAWPFAVSGADGAFTLGGLEDRTYRLRVMDTRTLSMHDVGEVAAGRSDLRIQLPGDAVFAKVAGVVVSSSGEPVAGVRVRVQCDTVRIGNTNLHGNTAASTTTDAQGRFAMADVPKTHAYLRLDGESILPVEYGREVPGGLLELSQGDAERLRIEVGVRVHVQIELGDPALADAFSVLDARGDAITINIFNGRGRREQDRVEIDNGRSVVFVVPDHARTLVLYKGGSEVRREALTLRIGEVNTLRW